MIIVYRHIREDTNKVFYIGIGTEKRAFDYTSRSKEWKEVKSKTNIKAEIIFESETREQAFIKEREFIKLYGRADKLQGDLINKTDGGGWQKGIIWDATRREKYSENAKKNRTLASWQEKNGAAVKGKKLGKQSTETVEKRKIVLKQIWVDRREEMLELRTKHFRTNNPSYKIFKCEHCDREIQGASAFKRFHGNNCKKLK